MSVIDLHQVIHLKTLREMPAVVDGAVRDMDADPLVLHAALMKPEIRANFIERRDMHAEYARYFDEALALTARLVGSLRAAVERMDRELAATSNEYQQIVGGTAHES